MKNKKAIYFLGIILLVSNINIYSQSTTFGLGPAGHFVAGLPAINWCGWDQNTPISFNVEHRGFGVNQTINFLTNGVQRMTILNSGTPGIPPFATGTGNVGIASPPFLPVSLTQWQALGAFKLDVQANTPGLWQGINISSSNPDRYGYFIDDSLALCESV